MGLSLSGATRADSFRDRTTAVTVGAYLMGAAAIVAALSLVLALAAYGWREIGWVLSAPASLDMLRPLGTTALIMLVALPITCIASVLAAASAIDPSIGGAAGKALRQSIEWSAGVPPIVVGAAVLVCVVASRERDAILTAIVALVVLNLPNATARLAHSLGSVPRDVRQASAALGASAATSFFGVLAPKAAWLIAGTILALAGQMAGETAAVAMAIGPIGGPEPLSVHIWHFASNASLAGSEAAACSLLVLLVAVLLAMSRACLRRGAGALAAS